MRCKNARILISASMDGELDQREERRLRMHVRRCAECAREQAEVSNLRDVMAVWTDEEPSAWLAENFACRLQDEMERKPRRRVRRQRTVFGTALAGMATALLAFGILLHSQFMPQTAVPTKQPAVSRENAPEIVRRNQPDLAPRSGSAMNNQPADADKRSVGRRTPPAAQMGRPADPKVPSVTVREPVRTSVANPPTTVVATPPRVRTNAPTANLAAGPRPPGGRIATLAKTDVSRTRPDYASRGSSGRDAEIKRMVLRSIALASHTEDNAESDVSDRLVHADMAMNESVEEVRGVIRQAVDVLARADIGSDF